MEYLICICVGYGLGCLNPAYFIGKAKHVDIRLGGTGNPGTTNAFINLGREWGVFVLFCDMAKAFVAVKVCQWMFAELLLAGVLAGCGAVIGHIFPFYMRFRGGKGIASFGGFILAADWKLFLLLLAAGCVLALIFNYGCSISFSAAALFPVLYAVKIQSAEAFFILLGCSGVIIYRHIDNLKKIKAGQEMPIRKFLCQHVFGRWVNG